MQKTIIVAGGAIGLLAFLGLLYTGAFGSFGNVSNLSDGTPICDVKGTLSGTVNDANFVKSVNDLSIVEGSSNCHTKGIAEFNLIGTGSANTAVPQGALLTPGFVTIHMQIVDKQTQQVWGEDTFTVNTDIGQYQKHFDHQFAFVKLPQGKQFDIVVQSSWAQDAKQGPELIKTITV